MSEKLKILAVSDVHGDMHTIRQLAEKAEKEKVDLVLLCGDLAPHHAEDTIPEGMIGAFLAKGKKVFVLHGNHESREIVQTAETVYGLKQLHANAYQYKNVGIFGMGGAPVGPFPTDEATILEGLMHGFEKIKHLPKKIMVTHAHPAGSTIEKFTDIFKGSTSVTRALQLFQPDILLCGHVHEAEGIEERIGNTRVINISKSGKIIEI